MDEEKERRKENDNDNDTNARIPLFLIDMTARIRIL